MSKKRNIPSEHERRIAIAEGFIEELDRMSAAERQARFRKAYETSQRHDGKDDAAATTNSQVH